MTATLPDETAAWDALRTVFDPEVGENIVDLGLVYGVECAPGVVNAEITMTTPACPASGSIAADAEQAIRNALPDAQEVNVRVVFDPPWGPERMNDRVKQRFGW